MKTKHFTLGTVLVRSGVITSAQLEEALAEQAGTKERIGEILCRRGYATEDDLVRALAQQLGYRMFDQTRDVVETDALDLVPHQFAQRHNLLPVRLTADSLIVALADPMDVEALDHLRRIAERSDRMLEIVLAPTKTLEQARETNYKRVEGSRNVSQLIDKVVDEVGSAIVIDEDLAEADAQLHAQDKSIFNLVNQIISQALQERATDIHIEPQEHNLVIRFRVDGMLRDALTPPLAVHIGTSSRIKILSNLDIAERRAMQDGRFTHRTGDHEVDIRVSVIPTIHGEKLVLRLLNKSGFNFSLRDLGFSEANYERFVKAIHQPHGMLLLSGPTGSGKSTTLYAGLLELKNETVNITTVEDPVEYQIAGINQVQVNDRKNVTFATTLRSFLRQDPDVIMVGEIRDEETADIAVRAALTGHTVFSTIHANDAPATATRLVSMGLESFMAASALSLVAAQRLVRRNCQHCLEEYEPSEEALLALGILPSRDGDEEPIQFSRGAGCAMCKDKGFQGRVAIVEMMPMTSGLRQMMAENRPADDLRRLAIEEGMSNLLTSGIEKVREGMTTPEEIMRVCLSDE